MEKVLTESSPVEDLLVHRHEADPVSPLGWGIGVRLLFAALAAALLWLAVVWALGWL